jgi:type I restriction enzyme, S subunit
MSRWPTVPLGTAIELAYGKSLPKGSRAEGGSIPVYGSNGIAGWHDAAVVDGPTVIVGRKGSAGAVQFVDGPCFPIDTTYYARPRHGFDFDIKFLFYLLRRLDLSRLKTATGVPGLTREDAYREAIAVPPLPEQRRIVDVLSRAEGIVRLRREAEKKAAELIPALFLDMFGDPATNPKGCAAKALEEVSEISYGIADKLDSTLTAADGYRILTISNVLQEGKIDPTVERYCKATDAQIRKSLVKRGDLLFNWRNGSETHIGKTAIWEQDDSVLHVSFLLRIRAVAGTTNPYFLWAMLNLLRQRGFFSDVSRQQINRKFNASELSALVLPTPLIDQQNLFAEKVEQIRSIQSQQSNATAKAQATFDALLAQAFSN